LVVVGGVMTRAATRWPFSPVTVRRTAPGAIRQAAHGQAGVHRPGGDWWHRLRRQQQSRGMGAGNHVVSRSRLERMDLSLWNTDLRETWGIRARAHLQSRAHAAEVAATRMRLRRQCGRRPRPPQKRLICGGPRITWDLRDVSCESNSYRRGAAAPVPSGCDGQRWVARHARYLQPHHTRDAQGSHGSIAGALGGISP
jgi:hypothetical protein